MPHVGEGLSQEVWVVAGAQGLCARVLWDQTVGLRCLVGCVFSHSSRPLQAHALAVDESQQSLGKACKAWQ